MLLNDSIKKYIPSILIVFLIVFATTLMHSFAFRYLDIEEGLDLRHGWEVCLNSESSDGNYKCENERVDLPDNSQRPYSNRIRRKLEYHNQFITPSECKEDGPNGCVFYLGGVSQGVDVLVNNRSLGSQFTNSDLYPASLYLPHSVLKSDGTPNDIRISVYTNASNFKPAVTQGPIGIVRLRHSQLITQAIIGERVVLPIIGASIDLTFALIALLWLLSTNSSRYLSTSYFLFTLISAISLLNATRLPRELMSENAGYALNFSVVYLMHFTAFNLVISFFSFDSISIRIFRILYFVAITTFISILIVTLLIPNGIDPFSRHLTFKFSLLTGLRQDSILYRLAVIFSPLMTFDSWIGLYLSSQSLKRFSGSAALFLLFVVVFPMQIIDVLTFSGIFRVNHEIYYLRLYPPFIGLAFGYVIWLKWLEAERKAEATLRVGEIAKGVAHDLRSPVAVLKVLSKLSKNMAKEEQELLAGAIKSIHGITDNLLKAYRSNRNGGSSTLSGQDLKPTFLSKTIMDVVAARNYVLKSKGQVEITYEGPSPDEPDLLCALDRTEMRRALDNLLANAIEAASANTATLPAVKVRLGNNSNNAVIEIIDNGEKLEDAVVDRLNRREFSHTTKKTGHGIGLGEVWRIIQAHGGKLSFAKGSEGGMTVRIKLPLV